jgi:hypothetical protein
MSVFLVLELLSGGATPLESMPETLQAVMQFSPTTHFVTFAPALLFRGAGLDIVWPQFAWVAGISAVLFTAALLRFRKTLIEAQSSGKIGRRSLGASAPLKDLVKKFDFTWEHVVEAAKERVRLPQ